MYKYEEDDLYREQSEQELNAMYVNEVIRGTFHQLPVAIASIPTYIKFIGTPEFRVFECLKNTVVRARKKYDPMNVYENYYLKGKLACNWPERKLSDYIGMDRKDVRKHARSLIEKEYIKRELVFNQRLNTEQSIYVIGEVIITGLGNIETIYCYKKLWDTEAKIKFNSIAPEDEKIH